MSDPVIHKHAWGQQPWPRDVREALVLGAPKLEPFLRCGKCSMLWTQARDDEPCRSECIRCGTETSRLGSVFDIRLCASCWNDDYRIDEKGKVAKREGRPL